MKLAGMLDSPWVRRTAVSLNLLGISFEHDPLSVFRHIDAFTAVNPILKAPSLVTDDGTVLMDSGLILEYAERLVPKERSLAPADPVDFVRAQRIIGLALAASEKSVQIVYEKKLRPAEKQHQPWLDRVNRQLSAAYRLLEAEIGQAGSWCFADRPLQADITSAVAFRVTQEMLPDTIAAGSCPNLAALSARAEATEAFRAFPYG